jgi:very-short-patch-repair endonuclease
LRSRQAKHFHFGNAGAAGFPLPLVGRVVSVANREGSFLPHSNIDPKTRTRAKKLRTELTKAEARMWNMLRDFRERGARFRRETPIGPYIADFAWLSARIVIEVDGDNHETSDGRKHDSQRDWFLQTQGFTILRFDNAQVIDGPDYVFLTIEQAISKFLQIEPHP